MVAWCKNCKRFVNQYCDRCGDNFGISVCEKYGCGGAMRCPFCGEANLSATKEFGPDPYDYRHKSKDGAPPPQAAAPPRQAPAPQPQAAEISACPMCSYRIDSEWKYCPMCGVSFQMKK
jgi:RNA polymerase subunit RPABC4/transcription elongation factor Spt4